MNDSKIVPNASGQPAGQSGKQKITTFLTFNNRAEEALNFYVSVFKNARALGTSRYDGGPNGAIFTGTFEIEGQKFMVLDGGPHFTFAQGISLFVNCETQAEVDELWERLSAGGEQQPCGWLRDQFGVSWQIVPSILGELLNDPDPQKARRVLLAMLQMRKLDIETLKQAANA